VHVEAWQKFLTHVADDDLHDPQLRVPPQPSLMVPQSFTEQEVLGVHWQEPELQAPVLQVPQNKVSPQPSVVAPQVMPWSAHVLGVQHCPDWQTAGDWQVPQLRVPPQPLGIVPHATFFCAHDWPLHTPLK